jgi:hypothetical protein
LVIWQPVWCWPFCAKSMVTLRLLAIASNAAFIT